MGVKKRNSFALNWTSSLNSPYDPNVKTSGVTGGVMSGTNVIYSNVQDVGNFDNNGLIVTYTGTAVGTIEVLVSELGDHFYALTFPAPLSQPAGSSGGYAVNLNQVPWRFLAIKYTNSSGSGTLTVSMGSKDIN